MKDEKQKIDNRVENDKSKAIFDEALERLVGEDAKVKEED